MAPSSKWCRAVTSHTALWPAFPRPASPLLVLKYCVAVLWEVFLFSGTSLVFWANVLGLVYVIGHYNTSFLFGTLWVTGHTTAALVCGAATDSLCVMIVWSLYQAVFTEPGFVPTAAASPLQHCSWEDRPALLGLPEIQQLRHETEELMMWSEWSSSRAITFKASQQASVTSSLPPSSGPPPLEDAAHNGSDDCSLGEESPSLGRHSARHASSTVQVADDRNRVTASCSGDGRPTARTDDGSTSVNDEVSTAVNVPDSDAAQLRPLNVSAALSSGTLCLVKSRAASAASTSLLLTQAEVRQLDVSISTRIQLSLSSVERPLGTQGHQPEPGDCSEGSSKHSHRSSEALYVQYVTTERGPRGDVRYCAKCEMYKPDRSHHCSVCGRCVRGMDHHCPWINNCVGAMNHKSFILFVWYVPVAAFVLWTSMLVSYRWASIDLYNAEVLPQYRAQILPGVDPSVSLSTAAPVDHAHSTAGSSHQKGESTHGHRSGVAGMVRKPRWFWGGKSNKSKPAPLYALHWTAHLFNYFVAFIAFMAWLAMSVFALFQTFLVISNQTTLDRKATQRMGQNDSADLESGLGLLNEQGSDERGAGRAKGGSAGRGSGGRQRRTTQWWVRQALAELFETRAHAVQAARTAGRTMGALLAPWRSAFLSRPRTAFTSPRTCTTKNVPVEEPVVSLPKVPWYVIILDVLLMFAPVKTNPFLVKTNNSVSAERSMQEGAASHMKNRECCASAGVHRVRCFRLLALFGLRKSKSGEDHESRQERNSGAGDVADDSKRKKPPPDRGVFALHDRDDPLIVTGNPTEQRGFLQRVLVSVLSFSARRGTTNHRAAHDGQPV